ncbi:MAG: ImmA/IrrE family metallo-endopeptidase [Planctomycetia bacterium]|nr:ImmA/IrrE family metallo-endopeptidase [Planctomycetia bacterium]
MAESQLKADVTPQVLKWARESLQLSVEEVAKRVRRPTEAVRRWESGEESPTFATAEKLAALYKRPIAVFFLPRAPEEPAPPTDFRRLTGAAESRLSLRFRLVLRTARWLQNVALGLAADLNEPSARIGRAKPSEDPCNVAQRERDRLGISVAEQLSWERPGAAFRRWRESLEQQGIVVLQFSFPMDDARGFSLNGADRPVIVVNAADALTARCFTLFHEFAHLLLRQPGVCTPEPGALRGKSGPLAHVEQFCNQFASEFLVPAAEFAKRVGSRDKWDDKDLEPVAKEWKVSRQVIWHRLHALQYVSAGEYRLRLEKWQGRPPPAKPPRKYFAMAAPKRAVRERGRFFAQLVLTARQRGLITASDESDFLGIKVRDLPRMAKLLQSTGEP